MKVIIGSARSDENGKSNSGTAGDQTGREVSTQDWYRHSKGWRVLRCVDEARAARIALAMQAACDNGDIGYDQWQRDTLLQDVKNKEFDPAETTKKVETDCSALVRVCVAYAFGRDLVGEYLNGERFSTANLCAVLLRTKAFEEMKGKEYTEASDRLCRGDILCTKTQGHVVVALSDGDNADRRVEYALGDRLLKRGMEGDDVRDLQKRFNALGASLTEDGEFGKATESAVKAFQTMKGLDADGEYGSLTHAALMSEAKIEAETVEIVGGDCWVRDAPSKEGNQLGVATEGSVLNFADEVSECVWFKVRWQDGVGWVSGKYGQRRGTAGLTLS